MGEFADFIPLSSNESDVNMEGSVQPIPTPGYNGNNTGGIDVNDDKAFWQQPVETSLSTKMQPTTFDWEKSRADRYIQDDNFKNLGFNPYASPVKDAEGNVFDANEEKYSANQTFSQATYKGIMGAGALFADTFIEQATGWWDLGKGIVALASGAGTGHAWADAQRAYMGSHEEMLEHEKEMQDRMNKWAVFQGSTANTIFSKSFLGNAIQQFGLGAGAAVEMIAEMYATMGMSAAFEAVKAASVGAKVLKTAEALGEGEKFLAGTIRTAEEIEKAAALRRANGVFTPAEQIARINNVRKVGLELQKASELSNNIPLMGDMFNAMSGVKKIMPGSGLFDIGSDIVKMSNATGESLFKTATTNWAAWKGGVGALRRDMSMFNMAATEAKMMAYDTYGQQFAGLMDQYKEQHGTEAVGDDLEVIKNNAWMASKDVFSLNVPLIMLMGKIEWGGLFSKFSTSGRAMRGLENAVAEGGEAATFSVKGKFVKGATLGEAGVIDDAMVGLKGIKDYKKVTGMFPAIRTMNMVRKDFGLGTALYQAGKVGLKGAALRFEISEGIQELLQDVSDQHFKTYYKNMYDGGKDIKGDSFFDAIGQGNWAKETVAHFQNQNVGGGWQSFIMGATGGLFMTPIHTVINAGQSRIMSKVSTEYKSAEEYRKDVMNENLKIANNFYRDPRSVLNNHVDAIKAAGKASDNMGGALSDNNHYAFTNGKNDIFAKTVSTFIKNGNYDSFLYTMSNLANMDEKSFYEALPNMKPVDHVEGTPLPSPASVIGKITDEISGYYNRWQALKDKYAGQIRPEYFEGRGSKALKASDEKRISGHSQLMEEYKEVKTSEADIASMTEEQRSENEAKLAEWNARGQEIEDIYKKETEGNQYYQQLMRKRALDEAIEVAATMGHNAQKAVENMVELQAKMMQSSEVGEAVAKHGGVIVNVLGDKKATVKEIARIKAALKTLRPVEGGPKDTVTDDIKRQIAAYEKQLEALSAWQQAFNAEESHQQLTDEEKTKLGELGKGFELPERTANIDKLQKSFKDYVDALNSEIALEPIPVSTEQYQKSLDYLTQHINYRKDHSHAMDAVNVIADPRNFQLLYNRIYDGMEYAMFDRYQRERKMLSLYDMAKAAEQKRAEATQAENVEKSKKVAELQKLELTKLLPEVESAVSRLETERAEVEAIVDKANTDLAAIEKDLEAAKALIMDTTSKASARKEIRKIEKQLRAKAKELRNTIDALNHRRETIQNAIDALEVTKENYKTAIAELEKEGRPIETMMYDEQAKLEEAAGQELTQKFQGYQLDDVIQQTKTELEILEDRIKYFESVLVATEAAMNDLAILIGDKEPEGRAGKAGQGRYSLEREAEALVQKFDDYTKDLADAIALRDKTKGKFDRLMQTHEAREAMESASIKLEYLNSIKNALEERKARKEPEPAPEKPLPKEPVTEKDKKEHIEKVKKDIVDSIIAGTEMSAESKEELAKSEDLQAVVDEIQAEAEDIKAGEFPAVSEAELAQLKKEKLEELAAEAEVKLTEAIEEFEEFITHPEIADFPQMRIEKDREGNDVYKISFRADTHGNASLSVQATVGDKGARQRINQHIKEQTEKRYPKLPGSKFRRGQYIYRKTDGNRYVILGLPHPDSGFINIKNDVGGVVATNIREIDDKFSATPPSVEPSPVSHVIAAEENKESPELFQQNGEWTTNDPSKINYDDINSITVHQNNKGKANEENIEVARARFLKFLVDNGVTDLNDTEMTLTVLKNTESGTYNPTQNPRIRVNKVPLTYGVNIKVNNKVQSIYLMANGAAYEFETEPGKWVTADKLTEDQFFQFFNPPSRFFNEDGVTTGELYMQFKDNIKKMQAFALEMAKYKVGDKIDASELQEMVTMQMVPHMNYSGLNRATGEYNPDSKADEVTGWDGQPTPQTITFPDGSEGHAIIINNGLDQFTKPFIAGWGDAASLEDSEIFAQAPSNSRWPGMYSLLHQLPTGQIIWIQLKPALMTQSEVMDRLLKSASLMVGIQDRVITAEEAEAINNDEARPSSEVEGGAKQINDILAEIFMPFNVYNNPGKIDYSQKWKVRLRAIQAQEDGKTFKKGEWHLTMFLEETFGPKKDRNTTKGLILPNVVFESPEAFAESINKVLHERDKTGKLKHEDVAQLTVDPENFRHQVFRNDINSVMQMATNLTMENGSPVKSMNVNWTFNGDADKIIEAASMQEKKRVAPAPTETDAPFVVETTPVVSVPVSSKEEAVKGTGPVRVYNIDRQGEKTLKIQGITKDDAGVWTDRTGKIVDPEQALHYIETGNMGAEEAPTNEELMNEPTNNPPSTPTGSTLDDIYNESKGQQRSTRARKIVGKDEHFDAVSLENIDKFVDWVGKNLPGIISVENLGILANNLKNEHVTVGTFYSYMDGVNQKGKISLYENSPAMYHEAFHAVFRLLLPQYRIQELLDEAKKENPMTEAKRKAFENKGYVFDSKEMADRFAEEHMADRFQAWKNGRKEPNSKFAKFFQYIADLFRELIAKLKGNKIEGLFYEINRGKYRNARLQQNSFTGKEGVAITQPANKAIWVGTQMINGREVDRFLPQQVSDRLSASIAAMFMQKLEADPVYVKTGKYNKDKILNSIMDMYEELLNPFARREFYEKESKNIKDEEARKQWWRDLVDRYNVFSTYEDKEGKVLNQSRQEMKESVDKYLRIMGLKQRLGEEQLEDDEVESGIPSAEKLERDSAFSLGGFGALSSVMRRFIGTVSFTLEQVGERTGKYVHDEFYNTKFMDGSDIIQAVDANRVYNGMLKAMANSSDVPTLMNKLIRYVDDVDNPETAKFVKYIFDTTGFDPVVYKESKGAIMATKNENVLQQVIKAFNQYTVNTKFIGFNADEQKFTVSDANKQGADFYQITNWQNAFENEFMAPYVIKTGKQAEVFLNAAVKPLSTLRGMVDLPNSPIADAKLRNDATNLHRELMDKLGINLHPAYIRYSVLKSKVKAEGEKQILTDEQLDFVNSYPLIAEIQPGPIANIINQMQSKDKNVFVKDEKGAKTSYQSLKIMAGGNAMFDESINMMSHKNAEGENVTNFVQPFYSGVAVADMNKGVTAWKAGLTEDMQKETANNPLINENFDKVSGNFRYMMEKGLLSVEFIDGMRPTKGEEEDERVWVEAEEDENGQVTEGFWEESTGRVYKDKEKEGKVYSDFSDKDFISALLSFYNKMGQNDTTFIRNNKLVHKIAVPIRVPAEKSMFALVKVPVLHAAISDGEGGVKLTDVAFRILYNRINEEFESIKECYRSMANGEPRGHNRIEEWNTGALRGTKFFQASMMLGDLRSEIEKAAKDDKDFKLDSMKDQIHDQLNSYFFGNNGQIQQMIDRMISERMMDQREGEYANEVFDPGYTAKGLLPDYLFEGFIIGKGKKSTADVALNDEMHIQKGNFVQNLSQVYMNAFLNTTMLNNLLHGNESKLYKNMTDAIKRESGTMATGNSIEGALAAISLGINKPLKHFHHITYSSEEVDRLLPGKGQLEVDDGHGLTTEKGLLYMLYGKGSINAVQAEIIKKLMNGVPVTPEEMFGSGGLKTNGAFNSLKMVYNDGQVYLKFSITPLFKNLTSYKGKDKNGKTVWLPIPGKEDLHDLRERMEKYEEENDTVAIGHPISSSKMLTRNVFDKEASNDGFKGVSDNHFEQLEAKYFKEQLQNPSGKTEITDPTQPKLQMPAEQSLKAPVYYDGNFTKADGKPLKTIGDMIDFFMDNTAQRMSNNFTTARDSLFTIEGVSKDIKDSIQAGKITPSLGKFLMVARENLEATGTDSQMIEFMDVDKNGQPKYNINFPSLLPKVTSIFFSYFSKGVLREKVPGMSLAIVSPAHGLGTVIKQVKSVWTQKDINKYKVSQNLLNQPREWTVIPMAEFTKNPSKYGNLTRWNNGVNGKPDKSKRTFSGLKERIDAGETVYVLDDIRDNYLKFVNDKPMGYYSEALRPAHNEQEMTEGFTEHTRYGFGTRIPYVDKNNATSFEFVDQLPVQMGSVMVVPREYYERTGADNDIDKDYVSTRDTYVNEDGKRIAYGTAKTDEGEYEEFRAFTFSTNKDVKINFRNLLDNDPRVASIKAELMALKKDKKALLEELENTQWWIANPRKGTDDVKLLKGQEKEVYEDLAELKEEKKELFKALMDIRRELQDQALKEAKLPVTVSQFIAAGGEKLNNGVLNNKVLDAKIAMLNNDSTVKNQNTPTTTDPLKLIVKNLIEELKGGTSDYCKKILDMMQETNVDLNSMLGMVNDRSATMMGANSIGSVATANIVYSFMNQMKTKLRNSEITIDGHTFNSFAETYAWDTESQSYKANPYTRIFAALGCLTNTMTDNAKERNANKLNLGQAATGFAAYLIATGMPEKTAYLYMIQPSMLKYMEMKKGGVLQLEGESSSANVFLNARIAELEDAGVKEKEGGLMTQDLVDNIKNGGEDESIELSILRDIKKMDKQSETFFKVAKVVRLTQGIKGDMESFDAIIADLADLGILIEDGQLRKMSNEEFEKKETVVDLRDALLNDHKFISDALHAVKQLESAMPAMFLERTKLFRDMTKGAKASLIPPSKAEMDKFNRNIKYDLLGYISIRAYKRYLDQQDKNNSLVQGLIFPDQGVDTIAQQATYVKDQLEAAKVNNYLMSRFLVASEPSDKTSGIALLESNTWAQLSEIQQSRLIAAFVDLYQNAYMKKNVDTHGFAEAMFNYLLIKDGGQFRNGSFIRMLPPFIFRDIMDKIGEANELLKGGKGSYEELFGPGVTQQSMLTDFMRGYTTHVANKKYILKLPLVRGKYEPKRTDETHSSAYKALTKEERLSVIKHQEKSHNIFFQKNQELTVNAFGGIRGYDDNKTGGYDAAEKVMLMDNRERLDSLGFKKVKGGVAFPVSFEYNNKLYTLQEVYKMDEADGKWKAVMTDVFIGAGEFTPSGFKAKYVEHAWTGSRRQFPAASAAGPVPAYKNTEKEIKKIERDTQAIKDDAIKKIMVKDGYRVKQVQRLTAEGKNAIVLQVEDKDGNPVLTSRGKTVGTLLKAWDVLQERKQEAGLTEEPQEPTGPSVAELQTKWAKEIADIKKKFPILPSSPKENAKIREEGEAEINDRYKRLIADAKGVTSQPETKAPEEAPLQQGKNIGPFTSDELNAMFKEHLALKGEKAMSPKQWKAEVMGYLMESSESKEEMIKNIKCF